MKTLPGYESVSLPNARAFAASVVRPWVHRVLSEHRTLHRAASEHPEARPIRGRGTVYVVPVGGRSLVVRRYMRGGMVAGPILYDRYLRERTPRPVLEALAAITVRARGIATPAVLAGAIYPKGPFYRADLVTEYIPRSFDLAAGLFGPRPLDARSRTIALRRSGELVARLAAAGVAHPDLNAGNILLVRQEHALEAVPLDLDRCRTKEPTVSISPARMLHRLERSLIKLGPRRGFPLAPHEWAELRQAAGGSV